MRFLKIPHFTICLLLLSQLHAQNTKIDSLQNLGICDKDGYCIPGIQGLPRPKGIEINQRRAYNFNIDTEIRDSADISSQEINRERRWEFKVRAPLLLNKKLKLLVGLKYTVDEFRFKDPDLLTNEFHRKLENKPLRSLQTTFYGIKPFKSRNYIFSRFGFGLNGDFNDEGLNSYFKGFAAVLYGFKVNSTKTWGFGLTYSYALGRNAIFPILAYNKQLNKKFGFEMLLPVSLKLRYIPNDKNVFLFENKLEGDNYTLEFDNLQQGKLFLNKSFFLSAITYEREIYDFFWFTTSLGFRKNINFDLSTRDEFLSNNDSFINNDIGASPFLNIGIFFVPPKKWVD